ncbi:hypothetical protein BD413DRAFT_429827, partial [Trametes elegans]
IQILLFQGSGDLVSPTRTCHALWSFLTHGDAFSLWTNARKSVPDLPEKPGFLSESAYAELVFLCHCHV